MNLTTHSHSDYSNVELATKEIAKVAERINESKRRKEVCDRILAKGRGSVSNINDDLTKIGRRADKLRSSFASRQDGQDQSSELYSDLVSRFAKQAIQVQVLARDLELWLKEYRVYLNSADALVAAMKTWLTFEMRDKKKERTQAWDVFFSHVESVSSQIFPVLDRTVRTKCIDPLQVLSSIPDLC